MFNLFANKKLKKEIQFLRDDNFRRAEHALFYTSNKINSLIRKIARLESINTMQKNYITDLETILETFIEYYIPTNKSFLKDILSKGRDKISYFEKLDDSQPNQFKN